LFARSEGSSACGAPKVARKASASTSAARLVAWRVYAASRALDMIVVPTKLASGTVSHSRR